MKPWSLPLIMIVVVGITVLSTTAGRAADDMRVLTIRPEKLSSYAGQYVIPETGRDPFSWDPNFISSFIPKTEAEQEQEELGADFVLQSIFWDPRKPQAIINDILVEVGDKINDILIAVIQKDRVILEKDNNRRALEFTTKLFDFSTNVKEGN